MSRSGTSPLCPTSCVAASGVPQVEQILISARALSFNPKAAVLTSAASADFVRSVGPMNANYIISPAAWHASLDLPCDIFGSSQGFASEYRARWGEEPIGMPPGSAGDGRALGRRGRCVGAPCERAVHGRRMGARAARAAHGARVRRRRM